MEKPRRRDDDILGEGGVRVELRSGVVPRDRKSGESVCLGMGRSFTRGYTGRESPAKEIISAGMSFP